MEHVRRFVGEQVHLLTSSHVQTTTVRTPPSLRSAFGLDSVQSVFGGRFPPVPLYTGFALEFRSTSSLWTASGRRLYCSPIVHLPRTPRSSEYSSGVQLCPTYVSCGHGASLPRPSAGFLRKAIRSVDLTGGFTFGREKTVEVVKMTFKLEKSR